MAIFLTASTGYLGSYLVAGLLTEHRDTLNLLVRAKTEQEAHERLWTSLQLHFAFPEFLEFLNTRVRIFRGDLTSELFGLPDDEYHALEEPSLTGRDLITIPTRVRKNSASTWPINFYPTCRKRFSAHRSSWVTAG